MIMTGQMKKYRESLKNTPEPILLNQIQQKMDLRGLKCLLSTVGHSCTYGHLGESKVSCLMEYCFLHKRRLHMKRYLSMLLSLVLVFTAKTTKSITTSKTTVKLSKLDASKDYYLIPEVLIHTF